MIRHYLKIARRHIFRFRTHYSISTLGLYLGLSSFLLILCYLIPSFTFDRFHNDVERIFRLNVLVDMQGQTSKFAASAIRLAPEIKQQIPHVEHAVRFRNTSGQIVFADEVWDENMILFADSSFFEVFNFPVSGDERAKLLKDPTGIVITQSMAAKYFPGNDPIGKILEIQLNDGAHSLTINGVVEDPPFTSSIQFDFVAPMQLIESTFRQQYTSLSPGLFTYLKLGSKQQVTQAKENLHRYTQTHFPEDVQDVLQLELQPMTELHYANGYQFDAGRKGNQATDIGLLVLAFLTLLSSVANYVNLTSALGLKETRATAIHQILGSSRANLFTLSIIEASMLLTVVMSLSVLTVWLSFTPLMQWLGLDFPWSDLPVSPVYFLLVVFLTILLCCNIEPMVRLYRYKLADGLRDHIGGTMGRWSLRKVFVAGQLVVTIFFLCAAWIVYDQLTYMQNKDLGFAENGRIMVELGSPAVMDQIDGFVQSLRSFPEVKNASLSISPIHGTHTQANFTLAADSLDQTRLMDINYVDEYFMETLGVPLLAGRDFSGRFPNDLREQSLIINRAALEAFGWKDPQRALGEVVVKTARDTSEATIIGVIDDYHSQSLHNSIAPMIWQIRPGAPVNILTVNVNAPFNKSLDRIETEWNSVFETVSFDYIFLDETLDNLYRSEQQAGWFVRLIAMILLVITCGGLYCMMLFMVEEKQSEIGIRKILGASVEQLIVYLNRQNMLLLIMGCVLGVPLSLYAADKWLQQFAYRIEINYVHVFLACLVCGLLTLLSVSLLTWRAANKHPVETLREE